MEIKQISEEQAREMWELGGGSWPGSIKNWKKAGYIEQSEFEKAKEHVLKTRLSSNLTDVCKGYEYYIDELEKEIERLNK